METIHTGRVSSQGVAIGRAVIIAKVETKPQTQLIEQAQRGDQVKLFESAIESVVKTLELISKENAIFAAHIEIAHDPMLYQSVVSKIRQGSSVVEAINEACGELCALFETIPDDYLRERAEDVKDVCYRLRENIEVEPIDQYAGIDAGAIVVTHELTSSMMTCICGMGVGGVVAKVGSALGHACIIARNGSIPAVVGVGDDFDHIKQGDMLIVDGTLGDVIINPDLRVAQEYRLRITQQQQCVGDHMPSATSDAHMVGVYANAGSLGEVKHAIDMGADGIGLFRSECIFTQNKKFPSQQEQYEIYRDAAEACNGKPLIIRTVDVGGDKPLPYFAFAKEDNPCLGWRGIRVSLAMVDVFKDQLCAILRAGACADVRILFPMVVSVEELTKAIELLEECKASLVANGMDFRSDIPIGVMIETPAAVMIADSLAELVDFFSIGSNDLTQYTLAVDRNNPAVADLYNPSHPALIRSINSVVEQARRGNISVGICGEYAANPAATSLLIGIGLDSLSVSAQSISCIKNQVRSTSLTLARELSRRVVALGSSKQVDAELLKQR